MAGEKVFTPQAPKLLDQVRDRLRLKHYSIRTETQYLQWMQRLILLHDHRHPNDMRSTSPDSLDQYSA